MIPFEIRGFPMPPSANALYSNKATGGRQKSQKYSQYEQEVRVWMLKNGYQLEVCRNILRNLKYDEAIHIDRNFYFKAFRILSKANRPLRNDTSNRIKALDDVLSAILGIDDCHFWSGSYTKNPSAHVALGEYVDIKFSAIKIPVAIESM